MAKLCFVFLFICIIQAMAVPVEAYYNNFDGTQTFYSGVTGGFTGSANSIEGVSGFSGIGTTGNTFSGSLLRNSSAGNPATITRLTLNNLPTHTAIDLNFLLAIMDSWDGDSAPYGPDILNIAVNGTLVFSNNPRTYANGVNILLYSGGNLGFNTPADSAYNMYQENALKNIAHTSSTLTIDWYASGSGWQGGADESWGIENVQVIIQVPEPGTFILLFFASLAFFLRKYKK